MTLLVTVFAAIVVTLVWYRHAPEDDMKVSVLCWMFWGASLMWLVDAVFEFVELRAAYFTPEPADVLNDFCLGLAVIALALVVWLVILLVRDPRGVLFKKKKQ